MIPPIRLWPNLPIVYHRRHDTEPQEQPRPARLKTWHKLVVAAGPRFCTRFAIMTALSHREAYEIMSFSSCKRWSIYVLYIDAHQRLFIISEDLRSTYHIMGAFVVDTEYYTLGNITLRLVLSHFVPSFPYTTILSSRIEAGLPVQRAQILQLSASKSR
jgi:hypothetical protein